MISSNVKYFHEIAIKDISGAIVILDIDGTITCGCQWTVQNRVVEKIRLLQKSNTVYLFSNSYNSVRSRSIAHKLKIPYIDAPYKKPNKKIINYIKRETHPMFVIGDKYLTDELFAIFVQAHYIRVKRYRCKKDSLFNKASCFFDDCVYFFAKLLHIVK